MGHTGLMGRAGPGRRGRFAVLRLPQVAVVVALALVSVVFVAVSSAVAAAGISLSKSAPGDVLAGEPITFTLVVTNPASNADALPEFNVSFADMLPPGLTYVPGSVTPAAAGEPTTVVDPSTEGTTLIWTNVADVAVGGQLTLTFEAQPDPAAYPVGSVVSNNASAAASTDAFVSPRYDGEGTLVPGTATETASAAPTITNITGLDITKSEPSPEGELLRGVHDHTTVYTLTVRTAVGGAVGGVTVVDYLPAQLEFLGCGGVDNLGTPEYAGAPLLSATPAVPDCIDPVSVTTVADPPQQGSTTYPPGVYTRVEWSLGTISAGTTAPLRYAAGVPLRANALWPAGTDPTGLGQIANLGNNTGPSTRETTTELSATNIARATGLYDGPIVEGGTALQASDDSATVSIEDLRIVKSVDPAVFDEGQIATYTVTVDTSEYVGADAVVLHDVIPNGLCPLGPAGTNYSNNAIVLCAGQDPGPVPAIDTATEQLDGTFDVLFAPVSIAADTTFVATYRVRMLPTYLGPARINQPTAVGDVFTNHVDVTASTTPVPGTPETGPQDVLDESQATVTAGGGSIDKLVAPRSAGDGACPTAISSYAEPADLTPAETQFLQGDLVCFALRADFSTLTQTRNVVVADFLPPEMQYVDGSATDADVARLAPWVVTAEPQTVSFSVGSEIDGERFVAPGATFAVVLRARVVASAPSTDPLTVPNLMKATGESTGGQPIAFRDQVDIQIAPAAPLAVLKGVAQVDDPATGPNGARSNVDGSEVRLASVATFRVDVTHTGTPGGADGYPVGGLDVWDVLPIGVVCADVSGGRAAAPAPAPVVACTDPGDAGQPTFAGSDQLSMLRFTYPSDTDAEVAASQLNAGQTLSLLYDVTIPPPARVGTRYVDSAYIHSFVAVTNVVDDPATFYPKDNIDPAVPVQDQTAQAASDPSNVVVPSVTVDKSVTTAIDEPNNDAAGQATIGELATYTYGATIPAGSSVYAGRMVDALPTGLVQVGSATVAFQPDASLPATAALPAGISIDPATGTVTFPATYTNSTAFDQRVAVTLVARVTGAAMSTTQNARDVINTATFTSLEGPGGSALPPATASATINVRQPRPEITKTNDQPAPVPGNTVVTYTVTARNANSDGTDTDRPPAHDVYIVDCIPAGLVFDSYGANPGRAPAPGGTDNGCAAGTTALVWDIGTLAAGAPISRTYTATVPSGAVGGTSYTNVVSMSGSTLADGKPLPTSPDNSEERSATVMANSTVNVEGPALVKTVTPDRATIGEPVQWTVSFIQPANTAFFDASVIDELPPGAGPAQVVSARCVILAVVPVPCSPNPTALQPVVNPDGSRLVGYSFGDIPATPFDRQVTVVFTTVIADVPSNVGGRLVDNTAHSAWNDSVDSPNARPTSAGATFDEIGGEGDASVAILEPDLTTAKAVDDPTPGPADRFTYTVTATNANSPTASNAYNVDVSDTVPVGVVVDPASISAGGTISGQNPVTGGGVITWAPANTDGPVPPGGSIDLTYSARLAPSSGLTAAGLTNTAAVTGYDSLPTGGRHYTGGSATATVTPAFPFLTTAKAALDPAPAYIGTPFTWQITSTNTGGASAYSVDVTDTLPAGWTYVPGSSTLTFPDGTTSTSDPTVVPLSAVIVWSNKGTLTPGQSLTVTFDAVPTQAVVTAPGVGSPVLHTNSAGTAGEDATRATANANGSYSGPAATADTHIDSADLVIAKTHADPVVAGADATWQVVVTNDGTDVAVGPFSVTDTLPAGVQLVSATGSGWSCSGTTAVTCTRSNAGDTLASGASFDQIVIVTSVPATTAAGTQLTNAAAVTDRTFDPDLDNNATDDVATVTTSADLAVTKAHSGAAVAGQDLTWTIDVVNNGPSDSQADIVVSDTLPAGATPASATGTGWACTVAGQTVTCTRSTALAAGQSAAQIEVVAAIGAGVTGDLSNTATVTGPTPDPDTSNNTSTDVGTIDVLADLAIEKSHDGTFVAGAPGTYRFVVVNNGPSDAAAPVQITDTLPDGVTYTGSADVTGTWTCAAPGQDLTCTLGGALAVGATVEVTVGVDLAPDLGIGALTNEATVGSPTTDPNLVNNTDNDLAAFDSRADLRLVKSHAGQATAGENLAWTLQVSNAGPSDSPGPIVVSDALPTGTTYVSATGTGWACAVASRVVTCTSNDTVPAPATGDPPVNAAPITLTVRIAPSAGPSIVVNTASVDGPLIDPVPGNNSGTDIVPVRDVANVTVTKDVVGSPNVTAGTDVDYAITVANEGPSDADSVTMVDTLPAGMSPISAAGPGWTCTVSGSTVSCARPTLAGPATPGTPTTSVITVEVFLTTATPAGTSLTNTALVGTSTAGDDPADNTDDATVFVDASADLSITKTHDGDPVIAGRTVLFTLQVTNNGPSDAQAVSVTDTLPAGLTYVTSSGPWTCTTPDQVVVTCDLEAGAVNANSLAPALMVTALVDPDATAGTYTNSADVSSTTPDPDTSNNVDTDDVSVADLADLRVTKVHVGPVHIGDEVTWILNVTNDGPSRADDVVLVDNQPVGATFVSGTGTDWSCTIGLLGRMTCVLGIPLEPGDTAPLLTIVGDVNAAAYPVLRNEATVSTGTPETNLSNNGADDSFDLVPPLADLAVDKSHDTAFVVGKAAVWHVVVTNNGPTAHRGVITVTDTLPAGVTFVRAVSAGGADWTCSDAGQVVTCRTVTVALAVGGTLGFDVVVLPDAAAYPSVINSVTVTSTAEDPDLTNNTDTDPVDVLPVSHLAIVKDAISAVGTKAVFRIVVTNTGPNATTAPVVVTDDPPEGMTVAGIDASAPWSCSVLGDVVTCVYPDALAVGTAASPILVTTDVVGGDGTYVNVATASGGNEPGGCPGCAPVTDDASVVLADGTLSATGTDSAGWAILAIALMVLGGGLVEVRRRSRGPTTLT